MTAPSLLKQMEKHEFSIDSELKLDVLRNISGGFGWEAYYEWREQIMDAAEDVLNALCSLTSSCESTGSVVIDHMDDCKPCGCSSKSKTKSGSTSRSERSSKC